MRAIVLFAFLIVAGSPAAAFEPTGNAVADTFLGAVERSGFAGARADTVGREEKATVLSAVAAGGNGADKAITIARVRITEPLVNADNDLAATTIRYEDVAILNGKGEPTSTIGALTLSNARLPGSGGDAATSDVSGLVGSFDLLELEGLTARSDAGEEISVRSVRADLSGRTEGVAAGAIALEGLTFDLALLEEPTASQIRALGYETLDVSFRGAGEWEAATGRAMLDGARLDIAGMGAVEVDAGANGLTAETYAALQSGGLDFTRLLNVLGTVSLTGLSVSLEDAGLTDRLLAQIAGDADRKAVVAQLMEALAVPLASLGDPAFSQEVRTAVGGFLEAPGRLTVAAKPAADVTALQVIGAAMLNPQLIPSLLSLKVSHQ